ncbi:hypothetical protein BDK51DRAFT_45303 [Blyttiomyces helicus]|uniref:Uncharacterized protein n=1 Tax=Blyttiomyces helicus TaxID=388810 RepID=A0A4P9W6G6_9FUNG|nr:hypothetical protein BDK51DRAFT_45303 [Blyttiomyces helicus]|eukprot:RKO87582.1 hypothetical protein BDK51DRAFT_45303 [Blyttiomyces helicus]
MSPNIPLPSRSSPRGVFTQLAQRHPFSTARPPPPRSRSLTHPPTAPSAPPSSSKQSMVHSGSFVAKSGCGDASAEEDAEATGLGPELQKEDVTSAEKVEEPSASARDFFSRAFSHAPIRDPFPILTLRKPGIIRLPRSTLSVQYRPLLRSRKRPHRRGMSNSDEKRADPSAPATQPSEPGRDVEVSPQSRAPPSLQSTSVPQNDLLVSSSIPLPLSFSLSSAISHLFGRSSIPYFFSSNFTSQPKVKMEDGGDKPDHETQFVNPSSSLSVRADAGDPRTFENGSVGCAEIPASPQKLQDEETDQNAADKLGDSQPRTPPSSTPLEEKVIKREEYADAKILDRSSLPSNLSRNSFSQPMVKTEGQSDETDRKVPCARRSSFSVVRADAGDPRVFESVTVDRSEKLQDEEDRKDVAAKQGDSSPRTPPSILLERKVIKSEDCVDADLFPCSPLQSDFSHNSIVQPRVKTAGQSDETYREVPSAHRLSFPVVRANAGDPCAFENVTVDCGEIPASREKLLNEEDRKDAVAKQGDSLPRTAPSSHRKAIKSEENVEADLCTRSPCPYFFSQPRIKVERGENGIGHRTSSPVAQADASDPRPFENVNIDRADIDPSTRQLQHEEDLHITTANRCHSKPSSSSSPFERKSIQTEDSFETAEWKSGSGNISAPSSRPSHASSDAVIDLTDDEAFACELREEEYRLAPFGSQGLSTPIIIDVTDDEKIARELQKVYDEEDEEYRRGQIDIQMQEEWAQAHDDMPPSPSMTRWSSSPHVTLHPDSLTSPPGRQRWDSATSPRFHPYTRIPPRSMGGGGPQSAVDISGPWQPVISDDDDPSTSTSHSSYSRPEQDTTACFVQYSQFDRRPTGGGAPRSFIYVPGSPQPVKVDDYDLSTSHSSHPRSERDTSARYSPYTRTDPPSTGPTQIRDLRGHMQAGESTG